MSVSWPEASELRALCVLLCRPSPPLVDGDTLQACDSLQALAARLPRPGLEAQRLRTLERVVLAWRDAAGGSLVPFHAAAYPPLLRQVARPPLALFVVGEPAWLQAPCVALVGTRAAAPGAAAWTRDTAGDLARLGVVVASGLARGIDAAAHVGALEAGGATIAVLGCGPDQCYPPEHRDLSARIAARGCLITELPPGTLPLPWHFPLRNRILAGIVSGVVVVQAEAKSGALITARLALDENRQVMAVPGDVADPRSRGPHQLLRDGAALVDGARDILEGLGWLGLEPPTGASSRPAGGVGPPAAAAPATGERAELMAALGRGRSLEALRAVLGWSPERLQRLLAELELGGLVRREPGGGVRPVDGRRG
jgi:DNA processing protein